MLRATLFAAVLVTTVPIHAAAPDFEIIIKDHRFNPSELTLPANTRVVLRVINQDATPEEFESHSLHREKVIPGNSHAIIRVGPLEPGNYEFFGEFNPNTARGMLIVK